MTGIQGVSKKLGEWYQKTNKTEDTNKLNSLTFKIIAILHNTLLATFIKLLETVGICLLRNRSQNRCHTILDCRHVCRTCAFHDALQAGKQKDCSQQPTTLIPSGLSIPPATPSLQDMTQSVSPRVKNLTIFVYK